MQVSSTHSGVQIRTPFVMTIFGATGDLTARKLLPALFDLFTDGVLPKEFFIVGFARRNLSRGEFQQLMREALEKHAFEKPVNADDWNAFKQCLYYQHGTFGDDTGYQQLVEVLEGFDARLLMCVTRFFYLAVPPQHYLTILDKLKSTRLSEGCGHDTPQFTRLMIEKPFGRDLETAKSLDAQLSTIFRENQIYRIDHYLGKETVQNILAFRFANKIFEPVWNNTFVDHIQITMSETLGVGTRGGFYDGVGALRDVAQNHLLQLLALVTMEEPDKLTSEEIRAKRAAAIAAIDCVEPEDVQKHVVRGQYAAGDGMKAYRQEDKVDADSLTETFVAMRVGINHRRWRGVPIFLRTGKRLARSVTAISVHFARPVHNMFGGKLDPRHRNVLAFHIQPREGISLTLQTKKSGFGADLVPTEMNFNYDRAQEAKINAYERILVDAMRGDQTLFPTTTGIMASWKFITKILQGWDGLDDTALYPYPAGSWGPGQADALFGKKGNRWFVE